MKEFARRDSRTPPELVSEAQSDSELLSLNTSPRALLPPMKHMGEQPVQHVLWHNRTRLIESGWAFYAKAYLCAWK